MHEAGLEFKMFVMARERNSYREYAASDAVACASWSGCTDPCMAAAMTAFVQSTPLYDETW